MKDPKNTKPTFKNIVPLFISLLIGVLLAIFFIPNKEQFSYLLTSAGSKLFSIFHQLAYYLGAALLVLSPFYLYYRIKYGKDWASKAGIKLVAGKGLMASTKKLVNEVQTRQLQTDTVVEVGVNIFWRFTRIGLIGLSLAIIPIWLLINQNKLLERQNVKIDNQNNLIEADRRSSLVLLMSNIIDQVNTEIETQKPKNLKTDTLLYKLSNPLIGRIAALSQSLLPYKYLVGDSLSQQEVSFERGQLLLALVNSRLDLNTMNKIYQKTNFSFSYLERTNLDGAYLQGANLDGANLNGAKLIGANLSGANLNWAILEKANLALAKMNWASLEKANLTLANLDGANLDGANLDGANLNEANLIATNLSEVVLTGTVFTWAVLTEANLTEAKGLETKQLRSTISLYNCKGIEKFTSSLKKEKPCLFEEPKSSKLDWIYSCKK